MSTACPITSLQFTPRDEREEYEGDPLEYEYVRWSSEYDIELSRFTNNLPLTQFRVELEKPCMEPYSISGPDDIFEREEEGDIPEEFADDTEPLYVGNEIYTINEYQYQSRGFNFFSMYEPSNADSIGPTEWGAILYNSKNRCPAVSDDDLYFDENFQDIGSPGDVYLADVYSESGVMDILDQEREKYIETTAGAAAQLEGYEAYDPTGNMETQSLKFFTRSAITFK